MVVVSFYPIPSRRLRLGFGVLQRHRGYLDGICRLEGIYASPRLIVLYRVNVRYQKIEEALQH